MPKSISALARDAVAQLRKSGHRRYLLGITGPPGAGKSTLVEALIRVCGTELGRQNVIGLPMDGFHLTMQQLTLAGLRDRKGAPETFDADSFVFALRQLADPGESTLKWPKYSRELHDPIADAITVPPSAQLIFVEGNYLLLEDEPWRAARDLFGSIWYVEAEMDTVQARLRQRQIEGGKNAADADRHVLQTDLTNAARVEETKHLADRVVRISAADPELGGLKDPATGRPIVLD